MEQHDATPYEGRHRDDSNAAWGRSNLRDNAHSHPAPRHSADFPREVAR
jgi:hypothetical protein